MNYDFPLLQKVRNRYKPSDNIDEIKLYSCMHLLGPQYEMYKKFIDFGFKSENIVVLGKTYSSNFSVINDLKSLGIKVIQPEFSQQPFDEQHARACDNVAELIKDNETNIVLDDGGYLLVSAKDKNVLFGVEQTSSGFHRISQEDFDFPIFNVARSQTKLTQESPFIAKQVFERVLEYLERKEKENPKVFVVGEGPIGEAIRQVFDARGFSADSCDVETTEDFLVNHLIQQKPDAIIGATGKNILSKESIKRLVEEHRYYLFSASSSDREFPVVSFRSDEGVHDDVEYKNITFVNNGFPISFYGNRNELTPIEIEKTIALLMGSIMAGVQDVPEGRGPIPILESLEKEINF